MTCGAVADRDEKADTWTFEVTDRGSGHVCTACTRANVRAIEGRLEQEWW